MNPDNNAIMDVLQVTGSLDISKGGPVYSVTRLCAELQKHGCRINLYTTGEYKSQELDSCFTESGIPIYSIPRYRYFSGRNIIARNSRKILSAASRDAQIIHSHGIWLPFNHDAAVVAARNRIPHLVSARGMLRRWAMRQKSFKKGIAWRLYQGRDLKNAACLHATSDQEAGEIRDLGLVNPIAVIPNGMDIPDGTVTSAKSDIGKRWRELRGKKILLFLSRLHPVKGLENLAIAWGKVAKMYPDWHLVIAGPDEDGHRKTVESVVMAAGVEARTSFIGPVYGELKQTLLAAGDLFVLPSLSEGFGIAVAEALAAGIPVMTTVCTPWSDIERYRCGWRIDTGVEPLYSKLIEALSLQEEQRTEMGHRGRRLIERKFSWRIITGQMVELYRWLLGNSSRPPCVKIF